LKKNFILTIILTTGFLLSVVMGFNAVVDPFRMFDLWDLPGFNYYKPSVYKRTRVLKAYEIRRRKPDSILLGSSRCHLAFSPDNQTWKRYSPRPYNLAFDGATTKEMYYYLLHAHSVRPLQLVLVGLDVYHPTEAPGSVRPDYDPSILGRGSRWVLRGRFLLADLKILSSFDTLANSIATLRSQHSDEGQWFAHNGQRLGEVFFRRPFENFVKFGPRYYFDEINKLEVQFKLEGCIPVKTVKVYPPKEEKKDAVSSFGYIRKMVEFCRRENIKLVIFITPSHATQMELSKILGEWPMIENGKRTLVNYLAEDAARHSDKKAIALFDFSGYSEYTTEALPPVGSRQEMQYYWDSSHFKECVGDRVLARILSDPEAKGVHEEFGVLLAANNFDTTMDKIHRDSVEFEARFPQEITLLKTFVLDYKREHGIRD